MKRRIKKWGFEKKMKVFFSVSIVLISVIVLLVTTFFNVTSTFENDKESAQKQLEFLCMNYESALEQYKSMSFAILMDHSVQKYIKSTEKNSWDLMNTKEEAKRILTQAINADPKINFIALTNDELDEYLYRGESIGGVDFEDTWEKDLENGENSSASEIKISFGRQYYNGTRNSLSIYFPAYSNQILDKSYGTLCINVEDTFSESDFFQQNNFEIRLVDPSEDIVLTSGTDKNESEIIYAGKINEQSGSYVQDGQLISYRRIGEWNYYIFNICSVRELYYPGVKSAVWVAFLALALIILCTAMTRKIFFRMYAPLEQIVQEMASVSNGRTDVRINAEDLGLDFEQMADGFNSMMDRLCEMIEEVKRTQGQISQTKLNALQSQIQPHFLYNTLECIHWLAVAEGNMEISSLVKALASYYRICLSRGKDIISLSEELEHIRYYMIIQNMRLDHEVQLEIDVEKEFMNIQLPKLTLQPLVENALEHGIGRNERGDGRIHIWVEREEQYALLKILDTGQDMTVEKAEKMNQYLHTNEEDFGYGVRNVNKRIELMFGKEYRLEYTKNEYGGATVTVKLPLREDSCIKY